MEERLKERKTEQGDGRGCRPVRWGAFPGFSVVGTGDVPRFVGVKLLSLSLRSTTNLPTLAYLYSARNT